MAGSGKNRSRLLITLCLTSCYMIAELVGGWLTGSLALLADAGHMFSDVLALALSAFAISMAQKPATPRRTFGYHRLEILAALANGITLVVISVAIFVEAYHRFVDPQPVQGGLMMAIATGGLVINLISLFMLGESLNVRGAYLHVLTDALGSIGALLGGALIWLYRWNWVDPVISIVIGLLALYSSVKLLKRAFSILMEEAPHGMDVDQLRSDIGAVPGVDNLHALHVWSITSGINKLTAHIVLAHGFHYEEVLSGVRAMIQERYGFSHVTLQIEPVPCDEQ